MNVEDLLIAGVVAGLIIGLLPGGRGASRYRNILVGLVGAILGSFVYKQFLSKVLHLGLPSIELDLNQILIALIGGFLFLFIMKLVKRG